MRVVVLRHQVSDTSHHFDWLFERDASDPLLSLRAASVIAPGTHVCTRLPDHRREYLEYEGEVSGNRGFVRRVQSGEVENIAFDENSLHAEVVIDQQRLCVDASDARVVVTRLDAPMA